MKGSDQKFLSFRAAETEPDPSCPPNRRYLLVVDGDYVVGAWAKTGWFDIDEGMAVVPQFWAPLPCTDDLFP